MEEQLPKYQNLANWIKGQVHSKKLHYGDKCYSENELSAMFGISRQTVRQAVGILEQEGYVERRRGSGTYIVYTGAPQREASQTIGVISTYLDSYIFPSIIRGIDLVLAENAYAMQLALTHNQLENEARVLKNMLENQVDGLIVEPTKSGLPNPNTHLYQALQEQGIPILFFNAYYPHLDYPHVCLDDRAAGRLAAQHLIDAGHRQIAGMFQADDRQGHLRYAGYMEALEGAGFEARSSHILWFTTEDIPYLSEDIHRVERCIHGCTALVCYNDQIACQVVAQLQAQGLRIPEELSVVGVDNAEIAALCDVPLTTIAHPMEQLGKTAAANILRLIKDPQYDATVDFPPQLVERSSVLVASGGG